MQIARNTKEFKKIKELMDEIAEKRSRKPHVKLFIVKPGRSLKERIAIDSLGKDSSLFFEMNFEMVMEFLRNYDYHLHRSEEEELYFFRRANAEDWDQNPFQFSAALTKKLRPFLKDAPEQDKTKAFELKVVHRREVPTGKKKVSVKKKATKKLKTTTKKASAGLKKKRKAS